MGSALLASPCTLARASCLSLAAANEVLVSAALRDLLAGSRIGLRDLGEHPLKGLPGLFRVYALLRPTLELP
jgi:class 3 adenylate cyclase